MNNVLQTIRDLIAIVFLLIVMAVLVIMIIVSIYGVVSKTLMCFDKTGTTNCTIVVEP
jgi:hypothetical protein